VAITLVSEKEQSKFARIEKMLEQPVTKSTVPEEFGDTPEYNPSKYRGKGQSGRYRVKKSGEKHKGKHSGRQYQGKSSDRTNQQRNKSNQGSRK
jgi:superfamily II DNA/RNA helicase